MKGPGVRPQAPRMRLASAGPSGARTQGGANSSAIWPTEDAAPRRVRRRQARAGGFGRTPKTLTAIALGVALLASASPATAKRAAFRHYVACGLSQKAKPSHICQKPRKKGAFFRSNLGDVFYTVCVKFPTKKNLCAPKQEAKKGTLYVNKITSNIPGKHKVTWFVQGKRVGLVYFFVPERSHKRGGN